VARLTDPEILARYKSALANWNVTGYVTWKDIAREWVEENLPGYTTRAVAERMHEFVERKGARSTRSREEGVDRGRFSLRPARTDRGSADLH
jgi:hypothetical protein